MDARRVRIPASPPDFAGSLIVFDPPSKAGSEGDRRTAAMLSANRDVGLLGARDLGDETGDVALDLIWWQVVAGARVRLAEIAANHEPAQPRPRQAFRLRTGQPADHLDRGGAA